MDAMLLRAADVARELRIGRSKAYELMATGQLPAVRFGRSVRVARVALEKWVRDHTNTPDNTQ